LWQQELPNVLWRNEGWASGFLLETNIVVVVVVVELKHVETWLGTCQ
jgi:hypothetical protein